MAVFITIDMLHQYQHYAEQFLPKETNSVLIGFQRNADVYITNFLHSQILKTTEKSVLADFFADLKRAKHYYVVGFVHTHPSEYSIASASEADYKYFHFAEEHFFKEFGRMPYFMIYAPLRKIFSIYTSQGEYKNRHIVNGF